jgi:hypothetical protein
MSLLWTLIANHACSVIATLNVIGVFIGPAVHEPQQAARSEFSEFSAFWYKGGYNLSLRRADPLRPEGVIVVHLTCLTRYVAPRVDATCRLSGVG